MGWMGRMKTERQVRKERRKGRLEGRATRRGRRWELKRGKGTAWKH
jgi:hypothetical protein